ncbi:MAG: hypothetical protein ACTHOU_15080 [Aureliella sp.]|jgi:hypothetical protein
MLRCKHCVGLVGVVLVLIVSLGLWTRQAVHGQNAGDAATKLKVLLQERCDILQRRVDTVQALVASGRAGPETVVAARGDLLDAQLALATDKAQKIEVLERKVDNAKQYEQLKQKGFEAAQSGYPEALLATAQRLEAEIELLRQQQ